MSNSNQKRWVQRLSSLEKALSQLTEACQKDNYSDLEVAGLVQIFEFTFELAWKTFKDLLYYQGLNVTTPRESINKAFQTELISETEATVLIDALLKRNILSHTYDKQKSEEALKLIKDKYHPTIKTVFHKLENMK